MGKGTSATVWNADARAQIRNSDVLQFLLDTAAGIPAVRRDAAGRCIGRHSEPDMATRISVATTLLNRVLPTVSAQAVDATSGGEGGVLKLVLAEDVAPPGSGQVEQKEPLTIDQPAKDTDNA